MDTKRPAFNAENRREHLKKKDACGLRDGHQLLGPGEGARRGHGSFLGATGTLFGIAGPVNRARLGWNQGIPGQRALGLLDLEGFNTVSNRGASNQEKTRQG